MEKELALAEKILDLANELTGWEFSMEVQDDAHLVGTALQSLSGEVLNIVFEVTEDEVVIDTFIPGCEFKEEKVKGIIDEIEFPMEMVAKSGEMLMAVSTVPAEIAESDTEIIIGSMMLTMVDALTKILVDF